MVTECLVEFPPDKYLHFMGMNVTAPFLGMTFARYADITKVASRPKSGDAIGIKDVEMIDVEGESDDAKSPEPVIKLCGAAAAAGAKKDPLPEAKNYVPPIPISVSAPVPATSVPKTASPSKWGAAADNSEMQALKEHILVLKQTLESGKTGDAAEHLLEVR